MRNRRISFIQNVGIQTSMNGVFFIGRNNNNNIILMRYVSDIHSIL